MSNYRFIQELSETTSSFFVPNPYFHWKIYYYIVCHRVPEASKRPSSEINDIGFYLYYSLYKIIHQLQSLSFQYTRCRPALYCFRIFCFLPLSDKLKHFFLSVCSKIYFRKTLSFQNRLQQQLSYRKTLLILS